MMLLFDEETVMRIHDATIRRETREETQEEAFLFAIKKMMKYQNITADEAMRILEVPPETQKKYMSML